jgi:MOSC domain-containing protein YiiM
MRDDIGIIRAISISTKKGIPKTNIQTGKIIKNHGLEGDVHAGDWHRQISLLAMESIKKILDLGVISVSPGDFAENITTENIDLSHVNIGTRFKIGSEIVLEVTQIGKECHSGCAIFQAIGYCVMPREGIFARVLNGGIICQNDVISIINKG